MISKGFCFSSKIEKNKGDRDFKPLVHKFQNKETEDIFHSENIKEFQQRVKYKQGNRFAISTIQTLSSNYFLSPNRLKHTTESFNTRP